QQVRGDEGGSCGCLFGVGADPFHEGEQLVAEDAAHAFGTRLVGDADPQQRRDQVVVLPHVQDVGDQGVAGVVAGERGGVGQLQVDGGGGGEQALLVAVVPHDHGGVDLRLLGDGADGGAFVAVGGEALAGGVEDGAAGGVRAAGGGGGLALVHAHDRRPTHVGQVNMCRPTSVDIHPDPEIGRAHV